MSSIAAAITRDFLSRGRWNLLLGVLGALTLPFLILGQNVLDRTGPPSEDLRVFLSFVTLLLEIVSFGAAIFTAHGSPVRLYPLPATTWMLIVCRLVPSMVAAAAMHVMVTSVLNVIYHLEWPLWGPALFLASAAACLHGALWFAGHTQLSQATAMGLLAGTLGCWLKTRFGEFQAAPSHLWTELNAMEVLTMALAAVAGFVLAYEGASRDRRGDAWNWIRAADWLERLSRQSFSGRNVSILSQRQAQFACEWSQKGWMLPASLTILLAAAILFCVFGPPKTAARDLPQVALVCGWLLIAGAVPGGMVFGKCSRAHGNQMGSFMASRPATNGELARAALQTMGLSLLATWVLWLGMVFLLMTFAYFAVPNSGDRLFRMPQQGFLLAVVPCAALSWILAGLACSLTLTGRPRFIVAILVGLLGSVIGTVLFATQSLTPEQRDAFNAIWLYGSGAGFAGGTAVSFIVARSKQCVATRTPWLALTVWCVLAVAQLGPVRQYLGLQNGAAQAFILGLFALALAPFATVPLAISWNRHR